MENQQQQKMHLKHGGVTEKPMYLKSEDSSCNLENLRHLKCTINTMNLCHLKIETYWLDSLSLTFLWKSL